MKSEVFYTRESVVVVNKYLKYALIGLAAVVVLALIYLGLIVASSTVVCDPVHVMPD